MKPFSFKESNLIFTQRQLVSASVSNSCQLLMNCVLNLLCTVSHLILATWDMGVIVCILQVKEHSQNGVVLCPQTECASGRDRSLNTGPLDQTLPFAPHHTGLGGPGSGSCPWLEMGGMVAAPGPVLRAAVTFLLGEASCGCWGYGSPNHRGFCVHLELCFRLSL